MNSLNNFCLLCDEVRTDFLSLTCNSYSPNSQSSYLSFFHINKSRILSSATFLLKAQKSPFVIFALKPSDCSSQPGICSYESGISHKGPTRPMLELKLLGGQKGTLPLELRPLLSAQPCIYRQRTHTPTPPHMLTAVFASTSAL